MKNNTIALLIGVLIVISVASILSTPKQIANFKGITGQATGSGEVIFNMSDEVSIGVTGNIVFGGGRVDTGSSYSTLDSSLGDYNFSFTNITSTAGETSPARFQFQLVFDSARDVSVLYGGLVNIYGPIFGVVYNRTNETWEFDHSANTWSKITPTGDVPGQLGSYAVSYDSANQVVILFGGQIHGIAGYQDSTWAYNGVNWTNLSPSTAPPGRRNALMAFDSARNVTVLFGGEDDADFYDTWEYNYSSNTWTNISTASTPVAATSNSMIFDPVIGKVLLLDIANKDLWTYNGSDWTAVSSDISADGGPSNYGALIGYDSSKNKSRVTEFAFDAQYTYTKVGFWEYNYAENSWVEILDFKAPLLAGAASYDTNSNEALFFAGSNNVMAMLIPNEPGVIITNETWLLNYAPSGIVKNGSWEFYKDYFFIENDGTVNISINYSADKAADTFIGGTSPSFMIKGVVDESGACSGLNTAFTEVLTSELEICPLLKFEQSSDLFKVPVKLVVPSDVNAGEHNSTITFTGRMV